MAMVQYVKNAGRTRHSARKAGITIDDPIAGRGDHMHLVEQEQPDIM
jgi:hypothetical protein